MRTVIAHMNLALVEMMNAINAADEHQGRGVSPDDTLALIKARTELHSLTERFTDIWHNSM